MPASVRPLARRVQLAAAAPGPEHGGSRRALPAKPARVSRGVAAAGVQRRQRGPSRQQRGPHLVSRAYAACGQGVPWISSRRASHMRRRRPGGVVCMPPPRRHRVARRTTSVAEGPRRALVGSRPAAGKPRVTLAAWGSAFVRYAHSGRTPGRQPTTNVLPMSPNTCYP